ncbi:Dihydrolipoyl dehydrogenase [Candidatus Westeberhardia cardiocondylae]|uniref:Dihydrolipoyl dehydrogenase n=1 Tax=Candidatus Westeberhardia cardiocondylae TaxID=1594731 RepID=A0A0H5BWL1_9ENTR|nr:dihydrolipoyl dehydrogenase [Candidatus Westeberhardia cardiocondylae]MCR3756255.1 lipoamide dehydrogenase [Candidatus Westeberhardia cardiocondylae]CEN32095.1 Dihydrolipoyl dehydrogenase [Candidatus Westeberhardia cardiocondylae]
MNNIYKIKTQVVVVGAGPGGYSAAFRCADLKLDTVLIDRNSNLGGVCLNTGCIPSKLLLRIVNIIKEIDSLNKCNITTSKLNIDLINTKKWKENVINKLSADLLHGAKSRKINVIIGYVNFVDDHTLEINNVSNNKYRKYDRILVSFDHAIIACGSQPNKLSVFPEKDSRIWNSNDALSLKFIPKKMLIVGAGAIGLEMATIYHAFGANIDMLETSNQIISMVDDDIIQFFKKQIKGLFNKLMLNYDIVSSESNKDGVYVTMQYKYNSSVEVIKERYDVVLVSVGRVSNARCLCIEKAGVVINNLGFISVDKQMRTNVPHIYAIGDIVGSPMLAHKSIYEGRIVAEVIYGKRHFFTPRVIPSIVYTIPEIGWVGVTEKEAKRRRLDCSVSVFPWIASGKAVLSNHQNGMTKLIFDKKTHRIIGGSVVGVNSGELLGEISLAIEMNCDSEDISLIVHAHPTLYESISSAAMLYQDSISV